MKKLPIHKHAEMGALSLMSIHPDILSTQVWEPDYFAIEDHRAIFEAMAMAIQRTKDFDEFSVISELESMGVLEKMGGTDAVLNILTAHTMQRSDVVIEMAEEYRRQLIKYRAFRNTIKIIEENEDNLRNANTDIREFADKISQTCIERNAEVSSAKSIAELLIDQMEGKNKRPCLSTGLILLDRTMKGGMHDGELLTVASESGGGKSIFMVQAAVANLLDGKNVVYFSLEMDKTDVFERMIANYANIPVRTSEEYSTTHSRELPAISKAILEMQKMPVIIIDDIIDLNSIMAECERLRLLGKADVIIIDYLQIIESDSSDNREQQVSDIARKLKNLATKLKVPVITGSQLNDEGKVRESRAIKQHSNQLVMIKHVKDKSSIFVDKNRRGPRNYSFPVTMDGEISKLKI
jgi:replicative DNA helicase